MPRMMKFTEMFSHDVDDRRRETWPKGWPDGLPGRDVPDAVAYAARKAGAAEFTGPDSEENEAWFKAEIEGEPERKRKTAPIPLGWEDFPAIETIRLAQSLGAPTSIKSKASAADYITKAEIERDKLV